VRNDVPITIVGNLTADPELRFTPAGVAVAALTVAVNPRFYDRDAAEWKDGEPSFYRVTVWRTLGENVAESLHKGDRVLVAGTIAQRIWEKPDGEKRSTFEVTAEAIGPDLTYAQAAVKKMTRSRGGDVAPDDPWANASRTRPADDEPPF